MYRHVLIGVALGIAALTVSATAYAAKPVATETNGLETAWIQTGCTTIQDGELKYPAGRYTAGQSLATGFDQYGYNYQSHLFKGSYANVYLNSDGLPPYEGDDTAYFQRLADENISINATSKWYWPYREYLVQMKWNDAWIANTDCDGDGSLDRHYGYPTYKDSGAWQTNQYSGKNGFAALTKFVAVRSTDVLNTGYWHTADGVEIGANIWGEFAITQDVLSGEGALYVSPAGPGYGQY